MGLITKILYHSSSAALGEGTSEAVLRLFGTTGLYSVRVSRVAGYPTTNVIDSGARSTEGRIEPRATGEIAAINVSRETLILDFDHSAVVYSFAELVDKYVMADIRGDFSINGCICTVGKHSLQFDNPFDEPVQILDKVALSIAFWGYSTPEDHDRFLEVVTGHPEFLRFSSLLESTFGPLNVGVFYEL